MTDLWERDGWDLADLVRSGACSAVELVQVHLDRIEALDERYRAWCDVQPEVAIARAREIDAVVAAGGDPGPWAGVPMGVKETAPARGLRHEEGSLLYAGRVADRDSLPVSRLRAAGAVFVGATTAPEFGSLNWTRSKLHGTTRNPWDEERTPGGSSGGSAAAVAAGMAPVCTGGDGGGSVRIPAAYCGLFGVKASFGLIPALELDNSLTTVHGPMCRSVRDAARYLDVVAGPDPRDPTCLAAPVVSFEELVRSGAAVDALRGRRAVWSSSLGYAVCDPEVERAAHEAALALAGDAGLELVDRAVQIPKPGGAWGVISGIDLVAHHGAAAEGRLDELTPVVRRSFELVRDQGIEAVSRAFRRRQEILSAVGALFDDVDLLLTPTTATVAFVAEGPPPSEVAGQRIGGMGSVPFTAAFNITGQPAVSIPAGAVDGLPVGLQVVARRHEEALLFGAGALVEANRPWPKLAPAAGQ
jgi:aspartyl-tRNA(Asn)/glutamyl-tRNA(Gln) amidotransferase subunit A